MAFPETVVSGAQTGVDLAALDAAIRLGLPHGGWVPKGRTNESGRISPKYRLRETNSRSYRNRTRRNVYDSDETLVITNGRLEGGTRLTRDIAREMGKPYLVVNLKNQPSAAKVRMWMAISNIAVLNVARPRESKNPGIYKKARAFLLDVLTAATAN